MCEPVFFKTVAQYAREIFRWFKKQRCGCAKVRPLNGVSARAPVLICLREALVTATVMLLQEATPNIGVAEGKSPDGCAPVSKAILDFL